MHSGTCLITISVDHYLSSQPGHSSMLLSLLLICLFCGHGIKLFHSVNCASVLIHCFFCLFSIVGNPLVCGSSTTEGCSGSATLIPISFSQVSSEGTSFYPPTFSVSYIFFAQRFYNMYFIFVYRKTQIQKTSNSTWDQS